MGAAADRDDRLLEDRGIDDHWEGGGGPKRGDRAPFVAGDRLRCRGVREGETADSEVGTELRPVELVGGRGDDEEVIIRAAADDDRAQERCEWDAGRVSRLGGTGDVADPDDSAGDASVPPCL